MMLGIGQAPPPPPPPPPFPPPWWPPIFYPPVPERIVLMPDGYDEYDGYQRPHWLVPVLVGLVVILALKGGGR